MSANAVEQKVNMVQGVPQVIQDLPSNVMQVSDKMILLTWLAFAITAITLHKLLWRPILKTVEKREKHIDDALKGAESARAEIATAQSRKEQLELKAAQKARAVIERAAQDANAAKARAEVEIRELTQLKMDEARRNIEAEQLKAFEAIRRDAANHLISSLEHFLYSELTDQQKADYQRQVLNEVKL